MSYYETIVGLEIHVELLTKTKLFCQCPNVFGDEPNTNKCPRCEGLPGALPVLNKEAVELAIKAGLALNCEINPESRFDRKNYFYPDLPKGYQITQFYEPVCRNGVVTLKSGKKIEIREIHLEDDAAKLVHADKLFVDYNRCGVPLIEIVTSPDFRTPDEVTEFLEILRRAFQALKISDCKIEQGSMRVDVNLSVHKADETLGTRTEMKNMASFKAISRAVMSETARQIEVLENGGTVIQETRRWSEDEGVSYRMRDKEDYHDYKYFPEPDLEAVILDKSYIDKLRDELIELPHEKAKRYISQYGLTEYEANILTSLTEISVFYDKTVEYNNLCKDNCNFILTHVLKIMNEQGLKDIPVSPLAFSRLVKMVHENVISNATGREILLVMFSDEGRDIDPMEYAETNGLLIVSDDGVVRDAVRSVLVNPSCKKALDDYLKGNTKSAGFLMGQVMRALGGKGDPSVVRRIMNDELEKLNGNVEE